MKTVLLLAALLITYCPLAWSGSGRVGFTIAFQGIETDLSIIASTVMPTDYLAVRTSAVARTEHGTLTHTSAGWQWHAPATPGHYSITFHQSGEQILLQVFVLTPFDNTDQDTLQGFPIGNYQQELFRGLSTYSVPKGFIHFTDNLTGIQVSPNFSINQFVSKQKPEHGETFLLVLPAMLIKLEALLEAANNRGWRASTLYIMSGFRTPYYNKVIGNTTTTSRHLYGGAADVWIDGDEDGLMDDLNDDGKIDQEDAVTLANLAESLAAEGGRNWPAGGLGIYNATPAHGPFIHIDARGYRARW